MTRIHDILDCLPHVIFIFTFPSGQRHQSLLLEMSKKFSELLLLRPSWFSKKWYKLIWITLRDFSWLKKGNRVGCLKKTHGFCQEHSLSLKFSGEEWKLGWVRLLVCWSCFDFSLSVRKTCVQRSSSSRGSSSIKRVKEEKKKKKEWTHSRKTCISDGGRNRPSLTLFFNRRRF